jgi:uncharacterized protein
VTALPERRLARRAPWVWRLQLSLVGGGALIAAAVVELSGVVLVLLVVAVVAAVSVAPALRWRSWRWDVRPDAVEIRRGVLRVRHTVVPMQRVQHVDTTSDIVEQALDLASVQIHTAADSHKIPLLQARDAEELRARIAALADES